jgi:hypothetical protein
VDDDDWDDDGYDCDDPPERESCFDPLTGRPRLLSEQCSTCLGRPGNLMHLNPGRLGGLVREALGEGSQGVICHQTLSYGDHPNFGGAICRWFYDHYGPRNNFIRVMERLGGFIEVAPPEECHA